MCRLDDMKESPALLRQGPDDDDEKTLELGSMICRRLDSVKRREFMERVSRARI